MQILQVRKLSTSMPHASLGQPVSQKRKRESEQDVWEDADNIQVALASYTRLHQANIRRQSDLKVIISVLMKFHLHEGQH